MEDNLPTIREFDGHDWFSTKIHQRNLPHWELEGSTYFITARVDSKVGKPFQDPEVARLMMSFLHREHGQRYLLHAYVIMPDHLHLNALPFFAASLMSLASLVVVAWKFSETRKRSGNPTFNVMGSLKNIKKVFSMASIARIVFGSFFICVCPTINFFQPF